MHPRWFTKKSPWPWIVAGWTLILIAGCAVGPNYKRPPVNLPQRFRSDTSGGTNSMGNMAWWELFRDPALHNLIHTALSNNYDIRIAAARVEQARAVWAENRAGYFPQFTYTGGVGAGKNAEVGNPFPGLGQTPFYEGIVNASWEVDLWGRIRRMNESARAQFLSTAEAQTNVMISLIASVASDYFQLLALDEELRIALDTSNSFEQSFNLFSEQLRGGVANKLATSAAEAEEMSAAATVPELQRQIVVEENQISILLGTNPAPILREKKLLQELLPPDVPPGLPSDLLERRPDIREAEEQVRSANAQIGVARANFFPRFNLASLLGQTSLDASTFFNGSSTAWSLAASLAGPIFEGGLLKGQLRQARASWAQTVLEYQYTVLGALQEVSNALIGRKKLAQERVQQAQAVKAYEVAVHVANQRYIGGFANYYELLQEQQLLFPAQNTLVQTELNQLLTLVQLYEALGGGWTTTGK